MRVAKFGRLIQFNFATTPITNNHFKSRVFKLVKDHLALLSKSSDGGSSTTTSPLTDPILLPLTPEDTSVYPSPAVNTYTGFTSSWIDLSSSNRIISSISRQVLNLEIDYANFCGIKSLVIAGPASDASKTCGNHGLAQFSRAIQEALTVGSRLNFLIQIPMCRELGIEIAPTLSSLQADSQQHDAPAGIDPFTSWDSWHQIRSVCAYDMRLFVGTCSPALGVARAV
jgi:type II protein arginine methyltransferase